ncbi:MAG: hypothetical protein AAGJ97_09280 [Planctomycetota bacterium]
MESRSSWLQTLVLAVPIFGIPAYAMFGADVARLTTADAAAEQPGFELGDVGLDGALGDAPVFGDGPAFGDATDRTDLTPPDGPDADDDPFALPERFDATVGAMSGASAESPAVPLEDKIELTQGRQNESPRNSAAEMFAALDGSQPSATAPTGRSFERVVAELRRLDVENFRVGVGSRPGSFYCSCTLPDRPLGGKYGVVDRRFEAEAGDRVAAAEAVLAQVTRWQAQ